MFENSAAHFFSGANRDPVGAVRRMQFRGAADEDYVGAPARGSFGEGVAHFAGRAVGQETHGIEILARWTCGDENGLTHEVLAKTEHIANFLRDRFGGGEAAGASHAAGEIAFVGINDVDAARAENR